jgi:hypothetical protein
VTNSPTDVVAALSAKVQATVKAQQKLAWTTPTHRKRLNETNQAVADLAAIIALSVKVGAAAKAGAVARTDALALGVGVSAKTAAAVKAGVSLGVGFSARASLSASLVTGLHSAIALVAQLNAHLATMNAASAAVAGNRGVMPPGRRVDPGPVDATLRALDGSLADAKGQAGALVPPVPKSPLTGEIRMARRGAWIADLATGDEVVLGGKVHFAIDEQVWVGTVDPTNTGIDGSRARCRVVAGNGGLAKTISGKSYTGASGVQVKVIVRDILHACGEDLSDLSDGPTLDRYLPRWHFAEGSARDALTDLADQLEVSWRVLRNGEVWFGPELWPEVSTDHRLVDEDWSAGALTVAPDTPDMVPGVVYQGRRIEHVTHTLGETLRTEVRTDHPAAAFQRALSGQRRQVDYSREWPCRVITQNPDYTLQLDPDDDVMKADGLDRVPIRYGIPGMRAKVKAGARCHLAFAAGDPTRPFAHNWESDPDSVEYIEYLVNGRAAGFARQGDSVKVFIDPGIPIPVQGVVGAAPFSGVMTIATPLSAIIETCNPSFRG